MLADADSHLSLNELREACYRHFTYLPYVNLQNFYNPDHYWLLEEFARLAQRIESNGGKFFEQDLIDAFYSNVFELEYGKLFLPGALVAPKSNIFAQRPIVARLNGFTKTYPYASITFYQNNGALSKTSFRHNLTEYFLVVKKDPLARKPRYERTTV